MSIKIEKIYFEKGVENCKMKPLSDAKIRRNERREKAISKIQAERNARELIWTEKTNFILDIVKERYQRIFSQEVLKELSRSKNLLV